MTFKLDRSREIVLIALLAAIAVTRIVACYPVFCQTYDEPMHVAAGMEWLDRGVYSLAIQNPPLARVLEAIGPWLDGARYVPAASPFTTGDAIFYGGGSYIRRLTLARAGNLPLFLLAIAAVAFWARRASGAAAAVLAVLLFTTLPPILAHAALATTDLGGAAGFALAMAAGIAWLEAPGASRAALFGFAAAIALLLKFSAIVFLPALIVIAILRIVERGAIPLKAFARDAVIAALIAGAVICGGYRFHVVPAAQLPELVLPGSPLLPPLRALARMGIPLPGADFIAGIGKLEAMNRLGGFPSFFEGTVSRHGHVLFYPTVFAVKTPITMLLLLASGIVLLAAQGRRTTWNERSGTVAFLVAFVASTLAHMDVGIRYMLPVYAAAAVAASTAIISLVRWKPRAGVAIAAALLLWQVTASAIAHPDYLADFNLFAGAHPERIVIDSDLDWGQDLFRLGDLAHEMGIRELSVAYFGSADPRRHDLAPVVHLLAPGQRATGWIAVSEVFRAPIWTDGYLWTLRYPTVRRAGRSIVLIYVPK